MSSTEAGSPQVISEADAQAAQSQIKGMVDALRGVIFGQDALLEGVVLGLLAGGHVLLEGLPGLGKTHLARALGRVTGLEVKRVQFTPDLLPGDITGSPLLQIVDGERRFVFQPGPVFCNLLLADEINRASPKTQSALLQAMQEHEVTVANETHRLPAPFCVLATQNPIELEGTYPLPEAQLDRFLLKLDVHAADVATLERIVQHRILGAPDADPPHLLDAAGVTALQTQVRGVHLPPVVARYIARLVHATHPGASQAGAGVRYGASPRAAIGLASVVRARALLHGRRHSSFEDVQAMALPILSHRILLDHTARLDGRSSADVVTALLHEVHPQEKELPSVLKEVPR